MRTHRPITRSLGALALLAGLAGCTDSLSLDASGAVRLALQRLPDPLIAFPQPGDTAGSPRAVQPDTVSSFMVTVTSVQFLRAGSDSADNNAWTTLQLAAPVRVDLMALPTTSDSGQFIAGGQLAAGTYSRVRLFVTNPSIRFKGQISFGVGGMLQAATDYAVTIPSAAKTGIVADVALMVPVQTQSGSGTAQANLVFDQEASLGTVAVTGTGAVMLQTVMHSR